MTDEALRARYREINEAAFLASQRAAEINSAEEIVRMVAAGHGCPQALCRDWVERMDKARSA